jgi:hypothetical protein
MSLLWYIKEMFLKFFSYLGINMKKIILLLFLVANASSSMALSAKESDNRYIDRNVEGFGEETNRIGIKIGKVAGVAYLFNKMLKSNMFEESSPIERVIYSGLSIGAGLTIVSAIPYIISIIVSNYKKRKHAKEIKQKTIS